MTQRPLLAQDLERVLAQDLERARADYGTACARYNKAYRQERSERYLRLLASRAESALDALHYAERMWSIHVLREAELI